MESSVVLNRTFQFRYVLWSLWSVARNNWLFLAIAAIVIHFVVSGVVSEIVQKFSEYFLNPLLFYFGESSDIINKMVNSLPSVSSFIIHSITIYIFLPVAATQITFDTLDDSSPMPHSRGIFQHFQRARFVRRSEFLFDSLRAFCIMMVQWTAYLTAFLFILIIGIFIICAEWVFSYQETPFFSFKEVARLIFVESRILAPFLVLSLIIFLPSFIIYLTVRWSVAVPTTVIENTKVLKSLKRSWHLTSQCKTRIFLLFVSFVVLNVLVSLVQIVFSVIIVLLIDPGTPNIISPETILSIMTKGLDAVSSMLSAVIITVCYYFLRQSGMKTGP